MTEFLRNVAKLLKGSAVGQLVTLLSLPVLSRLYGPEAFGVVQASLSVLAVLTILSSLRLEVATLSVPDDELNDVVRSAWWLSLFTALSAAAVIAIAQLGWRLWSAPELAVVSLLPVLALLAGWNQLFSYIALRRQAFDASANAKIVQAVTQSGGAVGIGLVHAGPTSLMLADAVARLGGTLYLQRNAAPNVSDWWRKPLASLVPALRKHRELCSVGLTAALINAAGSSFTAAMLIGLFSAREAGQYAIIERFVGMPIALIAGTLSQVFMANLAGALTVGDLAQARETYRRLLGFQLKAGLALWLGLLLAVPYALPLILGEQWRPATALIFPLSLLYFSSFVVAPVNMTLTVMGKQRQQLVWDISRFIVVNSTWAMAWHLELSLQAALWAFSIASASCYLMYLAMCSFAMQSASVQTQTD